MIRLIFGIGLISFGLWLGLTTQTFLSYFDFVLTWYGLILLIDALATTLGAKSLFANLRTFFLLSLVSAPFWWFYEAVNVFLKNWAYPSLSPLDGILVGVLGTLSFSTVLPALVVFSNLTATAFGSPESFKTSKRKLSLILVILWPVLGLVCLILSIFLPSYFFPLIWFALFLIFDPINFYNKKESLIEQFWQKNYKVLLVLALAGLITGLFWEGINVVLPKWIYPLNYRFWQLPPPFTFKIFQMPLAGYLGYIPFVFSAFAVVHFLGIDIPWLVKRKK